MDLSHLNYAQQQAVTHTEGPCMVIAGAGSGKTSVLTHRIAYLLREVHVDPSNILALTFTNKAAYEMQQRIMRMVGSNARSLWLGTFHSIFLRILRREASHLDYPSSFTIYDTEDSKALLRSIIKAMQLDDQLYKPNTILGRISSAKNRLITAQHYLDDPIYQEAAQKSRMPHLGAIFLSYSNRCKQAGAMDFDDLLLNTYRLLSDNEEICHKYQRYFRYLLIDEFQDTNMAQYAIVKLLAIQHKNICIVGDDAQSIYAFRGADIQNILHFGKDFPDLFSVKLEQNYRSTRHIVGAANAVIAHNESQLKKEVWTNNTLGDPIHLIGTTTEVEEGRLVANTIFEARACNNLKYSDYAVLYRTNSQSRAIEEALRKTNIPYRIVGGISFYQRKEVKDLVAYLRLLVNPNDESAFRRVINLPKRGIGPNTVERIIAITVASKCSLWEALCEAAKFFSSRMSSNIAHFVDIIQQSILVMHQKDAYAAAQHVAKQSGLLKSLYMDKTVEGLGHYENVQELLSAIKQFTTDESREDVSLSTFLQEISLATSDHESSQSSVDQVALMTVHTAKGLEFSHVCIVGMEETLFPSQLMLASKLDLEEERRLFYVALTRAKQQVTLTYTWSRYRFGQLKSCTPSRFLREIDPKYLQHNTLKSTTLTSDTTYAHRLVRRIRKHTALSPTSQPCAHDRSEEITPCLTEGTQVIHPKFGRGTIQKIELRDETPKAKINFSHFGEKTLLLKFAKLKPIDTHPD